MKLKNIATVGLIIALFFIVAALFINFDLVPNINSFTKVCLQTFFIDILWFLISKDHLMLLHDSDIDTLFTLLHSTFHFQRQL